nr:immunoglobulin light chain junction region [Macaca mulatta]
DYYCHLYDSSGVLF